MNQFNPTDICILGVFILSGLLGMTRGVIREVLSLLTWIAAFIIASLFATKTAALFSGMMSTSSQAISLFSISISFVCLFILTILVGSIITHFISRMVESGGISVANRLLGAIFGVLRGVLIVLIIIFLVEMTPIANQIKWRESQLVSAFQPSVNWLRDAIQPEFSNIKERVGSVVQDLNEDLNKEDNDNRDSE